MFDILFLRLFKHNIHSFDQILSNIIIQSQEIIKAREWIPHIGLLSKVIRLKLFLDMVTSSYPDITRAVRRQPKSDFLETTRDEMAGMSL